MKIIVIAYYQNDFIIGRWKYEKAKELDENIAEKISNLNNKNSIIVLINRITLLKSKYVGAALPCATKEGRSSYGKTGAVLRSRNNSDTVYVLETRTDTLPPSAIFDLKDLLKKKKIKPKNITSIEFIGIAKPCISTDIIAFQSVFPDANIVLNSEMLIENTEEIARVTTKLKEIKETKRKGRKIIEKIANIFKAGPKNIQISKKAGL